MVNVGLITLPWTASGSLSGGEAQRIRLATQIGSGLTESAYPRRAQHRPAPAGQCPPPETLKRLRDLGNTLIVVEHDEDTMRAADWIIDIGPGPGAAGGEIVAQGRMEDIIKEQNSITGQYLSGQRFIPIPEKRRPGNGQCITVRGARENNLKNLDVSFPLNKFICVTGVSGSGKSSLVNEVLHKALAQKISRAKVKPGDHDAIEAAWSMSTRSLKLTSPPSAGLPLQPRYYTGLLTSSALSIPRLMRPRPGA